MKDCNTVFILAVKRHVNSELEHNCPDETRETGKPSKFESKQIAIICKCTEMLRKQDNPQAFLKMGKILLLIATILETTHHCTYDIYDATLQNTS